MTSPRPTSTTRWSPSAASASREREPRATWRQADATRLPFDDGSFDVVACQFGAVFFPDKVAAFAEARRVLAPGGVFALNVWGALGEHDFQAALFDAAEDAVPGTPARFMRSVVHGYAGADVIAGDLRAAGFHRVRTEAVTLEGRAGSVADLAAGYCTGTPMRAELEAQGDLDVVVAVAERLEARFGSGPDTGSMTALAVEAVRS